MNMTPLRTPFVLLLLTLAACASTDKIMLASNHSAARTLEHNAGTLLSPSHTLIAATFANIDDLATSSSFGRVTSQQIVSGLTSQGYSVIDILLRNSIYVDENEGEFLLSREISNIRSDYQADVVLAGTYAVGNEQVFVTAKLIRATDGVILASHDYSLPYAGEPRALITGERIDEPGLFEQLMGF